MEATKVRHKKVIKKTHKMPEKMQKLLADNINSETERYRTEIRIIALTIYERKKVILHFYLNCMHFILL